MNNYLIEANTNPCLEESNELLKNLIPRMIDDTLNLVCDPVFYNVSEVPHETLFLLPG